MSMFVGQICQENFIKFITYLLGQIFLTCALNFNFHFQINLQNEDLKILVVTKCAIKIYRRTLLYYHLWW